MSKLEQLKKIIDRKRNLGKVELLWTKEQSKEITNPLWFGPTVLIDEDDSLVESQDFVANSVWLVNEELLSLIVDRCGQIS